MKDSVYVKIMLSFVLTMATMAGKASPITLETAKGNAMKFLNSTTTGAKRVKGNPNLLQLAGVIAEPTASGNIPSSSEPALYAFNLKGGGFVLVSGDDAAEPILAYGNNYSFNLDSLPSSVRLWIEGYVKEIAWARSNNLTAASRNNAKATAPLKARSTITTMLKSQWNQEAPYNDQCIFNNTRCLTGCGATAMAQILYYWATIGKNGAKFAKGCRALAAYTTYTNKYNIPALGAVSTFDWGNMTNGKPSTSTSKTAVAKLMRYCGQSVQTDFASNWSSSFTDDICESFKNNFFYNSGVTFVSHNDKTESAWEQMIYYEMVAKRPVIIAGYNSSYGEGHFFICDGYDASKNKYHMNWGWGGWYDGFFAMNALNPDGRNYSYYKDAIIGIEPTAASQYVAQSADSKTITFYYDNNKAGHSAESLYDLSSFTSKVKNKTSVTKVVFDASFANARPTSTYSWFSGMSALTSITNIKNLNTSATTNMSYMFSGCKSFTSLDLTTLNFGKNPSVSSICSGCSGLKTLSLPSNFPNNGSSAFNNVGSATAPCILTVASNYNFGSGINANTLYFRWCSGYFYKKGTNVPYAFLSGTSLTFLYDASPWSRTGTKYSLNSGTATPEWSGSSASITQVEMNSSFANARPTSTYKWFNGMSKLTTIKNIGYLNTSAVTNMSYMYCGCQALTSIYLPFTTDNVTNMSYMFDGCTALVSLNLSRFNMSKVTSSSYMARNCKAVKELIIPSTISGVSSNAFTSVGTTSAPCLISAPSGFNFGTDMTGFYFNWKSGCFYLKGNKLSYAMLNGQALTFYYDDSTWSRSGTRYLLNKGTTAPGWSSSIASVTQVSFDTSFANARPTSTYKWFSGMSSLTTVSNSGNLNMSEVTNNSHMFDGCTKLAAFTMPTTIKSIDASMFINCSSLKSIDIPASVKSIGDNAFYGCSSLGNVTVRFSTPLTIAESVFSNRKNAFLSVPVGCRNAFFTANYWKDFKGFLEDGKYIPGDVNHDGQMTINDVTLLVNFILGNTSSGLYIESADANRDGSIDIGDVTYLSNHYILLK